MIRSRKQLRAFTLVELVVSIAIFAMMTALVVAKYSTFNSSVLLTNAAYDVALAIRTAQTYGLSVKSTDTGVLPPGYGIYFNKSYTGANSCISNDPSRFVLFADVSNLVGFGRCDAPNEIISTFNLKYGFTFDIMINDGSATVLKVLSVTFKRPNPEANFSKECEGPNGVCPSPNTNDSYMIVIRSTGGDVRKVVVYPNGQITVQN